MLNPKVFARSCLLAATFTVCAAQAQRSGDTGSVALPTGQTITPQALPGRVQQFLNPGLAAHPEFVAGEAVRSQLSPDGKTLAIITAGQNSLYTPAGSVDVANSTSTSSCTTWTARTRLRRHCSRCSSP